MLKDMHGLELTAAGAEAARAFDDTLEGYTKHRADTPDRLARALEVDSEFCLAHCLKGYFALSAFKLAGVAGAARSAADARRHSVLATPRERLHVDALEAWVAGRLDRALAIWERILGDHPADLLALRMAHFNYFWLGRRRDMQESVERALPAWNVAMPGYGTVLACRAFALEENQDYPSAEANGRAAVEIDPADLWATHAVAHVMEMQGRHAEGIAWLSGLGPNWLGANNLAHHLWWHRAMYHLERREFDEVLGQYDRFFRDLESPLVQAQPDLYIDVQNAASMLFRLGLQGVDVGARWIEIADKAEARIGDCKSAFTLPHWMMALAACGRDVAAARLLEGMRAFAAGSETTAQVVGTVALPVCEAVLAHARGEYARAVERIGRVSDRLFLLGGSMAQQDVLHQLYVNAALKAGRAPLVRELLAQQDAAHPVSAQGRIGYREALVWLRSH